MKKIVFIALFVFLISPPVTFSAEKSAPAGPITQTITLKDGTIIKGHLINVANDEYVVQTPHMGQIKVHAADLLSIANNQTSAGAASTQIQQPAVNLNIPSMGTTPPGMGQIQQQLLSDPEIIESLQSLLSDPETAKLLMDPKLLQDALTMDPEKLKANPATQQLLQNPKMQDVIKKVGQKLVPAAP